MDDSDAKLLTRVQARFPLEPRPFQVLGNELGMPEAEVLARTRRLVESGLIRRIGATFHPERLGYVSTLAGMRVPVGTGGPGDRLEAVADVVARFVEVTHCYERDDEWNLWFTMTAESSERIEAVLDAVRGAAPGCPLMSLPARKRYKLRVEFDLDRDDTGSLEHGAHGHSAGDDASRVAHPAAELDVQDKALIARLCGELPLTERPFEALAVELGTTERDVLDRVRRLEHGGALRRCGAMIRHRKAGMTHNAMVAWVVPEAETDAVGMHAASFGAVSHCYVRSAAPGWPYTLYTMIHGSAASGVEAVIEAIAARFGLTQRRVLTSRREFKKSSVRYFDTGSRTTAHDVP
ncbi:MAG: Lrp/AsnC family transcriptional regulator [Verrucomicrobia bacterium]|nr:Lrp/AsnC family transcriptional regulator [Verrucomicrobiota bacterium]